MKRIVAFIIFLCFLLIMTGCSAKEDGDKNEAENETSITEVNHENETKGEDEQEENNKNIMSFEDELDLEALSEELSMQMVDEDFDEVYDTLSLLVRAQMSKEALEQAWNTNVTGLGEFIKLYEITQEESDPYRIVKVILQFENNGLQIAYTYNKSGKLDGLWFSYAPITAEVESNDTFKEIEINIGDEEYPVDGILTLPQGIEKPPVVILVHGSGTHDMNESIGPNKPFRDIAHGLARQGIASIRYHEFLLQYPKQMPQAFTIYDDSLNDVERAIDFTLNSDQVDTDNIYIIGHSLGGMLAPKIASDHEAVAGIVILAGSPRKLEDISFDQNLAVLDTTPDVTTEQRDQIIAMLDDQLNKIKGLTEDDTDTLLGIPASYWYSLNQINTPEIVANLDIPIFIGQGSADWQVYPEKDYAGWMELLADKDNVTFKLYDNLNHLFMTSNGKTDVSEYNIQSTVDQKVIDDMAEWINQNQ
ncbi:alpha/beta fold hydrolase [Mobilitalea sibirica]|uniref:Alpha/beta fold hydrolase n=1 Tax=Mobilitalea sibirica TaxID=1462919 RepID=A0A8J7GYJ7_9FIRM|nr:S-layer protein [Mobilitalea sibirica]MBH1940599.1 alpha/beta fold hydrolase [Mobilitalea sibirica]